MQSSITERVSSLYHELRAAPSLRPSEHINRVFTELVHLTINASEVTAAAVLNDARIQRILPHLRELCSTGEYELELDWARRIAAADYPVAMLERFPYYRNYQKLTDLEYQALRLGGRRRIRRVLFVGSGPLPLSAVLLARQYGIFVDGIDSDEAAVAVSQQLVRQLGLSDLLQIRQADAATFANYRQYDAVFLAALVGLEAEVKRTIAAVIQDQMRPGSLLVMRSAHGLRQLLYPVIEPEEMEGLMPQAVIHPLNEVVNSVVLFEKPHGDISWRAIVRDKAAAGSFARFQEFCRSYISDVYGYAHNPAWHTDIDRAAEVYSQERSNLFVIELDGRVVAAAAIRPYDRQYQVLDGKYDEQTGAVWRFFVDPEFADLGLEQLLQVQLQAFARTVGFTRLYAHDQRDVPGAVRRYLDAGYRVTVEAHDAFGTVHFEKELDHDKLNN